MDRLQRLDHDAKMTDATRSAVAYLAGTLITEKRGAGVFDANRDRFIAIQYAISGPLALLRSEEETIHLHARIEPAIIHLQDFTTNSQIHMVITDQKFEGTDEHTSSNFSGHLDGGMVFLFDEDGRKNWYYTL